MQKTEELSEFYEKLMRANTNKNDFKRQSAEDLLARHTNKIGESRHEAGKKILDTIRKDTSIPVISEEKDA